MVYLKYTTGGAFENKASYGTNDNVFTALLPVRSMRQGYAFVSVGMCVCVCVCVWTKNTLVYVSPLENLHKNSLCSFFTEFIVTRRRFLCWQALFERLIHGYLKLRVLVRALYGIVGVSPNLLSMSMSSLSLTCTVRQRCARKILL